MSSSLLQLRQELLHSIEQRDAGDPDAPAWEAAARIKRLEAELERLAAMAAGSVSPDPMAGALARQPDEALAGAV